MYQAFTCFSSCFSTSPKFVKFAGYAFHPSLHPQSISHIPFIQRKGDLIYWLIYVHKYNEPFDDMLWMDELTRMMGSIK